MSLKILHFADLHLGRGFTDYGIASEKLSEARYKTLDHLIDIANEQSCDVVVIAGDLFDRTSMNKGDVIRAVQSLNNFTNGPVLLLPGNHDYITSESKLWDYVGEAKNDQLKVLKDTTPLDLIEYDLDAIIYPAPCDSKHSSANKVGWVKDVEKDLSKIHIGIAHGSVTGVAPDFNDEHFPMTKEELKNAGVDLWLLGHIHVPWPDKPGGRDTILYSGTPEPDTANCPHKGTALLIEIEGNKSISIDRLKTGTYKFERWREEVTSFTDLEKLADRVKKEENANSVCRLSIKGVLDPEDYHRWQDEILPGLKDSFLYLRINDLELRKRITIDQLYDIYPEESFPTHLLSGFIEEDDQDALQTAYDLLEEVKDEN